MSNERSVDFIIRAKNQSKRTLAEVQKEIQAVSDAIEDQVAASRRGEGSTKALEEAYKRLNATTKDLTSQQKTLTTLEAQANRMAELEARLERATTALRNHQAEMAKSESVTKTQEAADKRLQNAVQRASDALGRQEDRLQQTRTAAEAAGLAIEDTARAQDELLATARSLVAANSRLSESQAEVAANNAKARREAEQLAAVDAIKQKAAEAQELIKAADYANWWSESLNKAEQAEKDLAAVEAIKQKAAEAQQMIKAADYANWWVDALDKAADAERQLANQNELNEMADRAIAATRGFTTLGNASARLKDNLSPVADEIRGINDPAAKVRRSLAGIEEQVDAVSAQLNAGKGEVRDYQASLRTLAQAQKGTVDIGSQIDQYNRQIEALRQSRTEFNQARDAARQFAAEIRQAAQPTAQMETDLRRLEAEAARAGQRMQQSRADARAMRDALRRAGIDTSRLSEEQKRLVATAKNANEAIRRLNDAYQKNGDAAKKASKNTGLFRDEGRTTLSLTQRIRGEILSLAAAYVGLQGAVDLATGSIKAYNDVQALGSQLSISKDIGTNAQLIEEEIQYIRDLADRVGVSYEALGKSYAKFSASASLTGRSRQEIRYVAETFTEVGRVANLTADDIDGVFKALEQMYSKGKIQAEELRGQLGDRLFGAFEVFQEALKEDFPDLSKAMENGEVTADYIVKAAEAYRNLVAESLPAATQRLAANQARLNNEITYFRQTIAEAGFADQYERLVEVLTEFFQSDDGERFARGISQAFGTVVDVIAWAVENFDTLEIAAKAVFTVLATNAVARATSNIGELAKSVQGLNADFATANTRVKILRGSLAAVNAAVIGWQIGTWARNEFEIVERAGNKMVELLLLGWNRLQYGFEIAFTAIEGYSSNILNTIKNEFKEWFNDIVALLEKLAEFVGSDEFQKKLDGVKFDNTKAEMRDVGNEMSMLRAKMQQEAERIKQIFADMNANIGLDIGGGAGGRLGDGPGAGPDGEGGGRKPGRISLTGVPHGQEDPNAAIPPSADALAEAQIAASRRATQAIQADLRIQEQTLRQLHERSLIATTDYYNERTRIAQEGINAEIGQLQEELEVLNNTQAKNADDELKRQTEIKDIQSEILNLTKEKGAAEQQFAYEAEMANEQLKQQAQELENSILEAQGDKLQAQLNRNQAAYDQNMKTAGKLTGAERERFEANAMIQKSLADQNAQMGAAMEKAQKMEAAARTAAQYMDALLDAKSYSGEFTDLEAMRAEGRINEEKLRQLAQVRDAYLAAGEAGKAAAIGIEAEMAKLAVRLDPIADEIRSKFEDAFGNFFENLILKRQSFGEAFRQLGYELATEFAKMWIKEATQQLMKWFIQQGVFKFLSGVVMPMSNTAGMNIVGSGSNIFGSLMHSGGVVGDSGNNGVRRSGVNPSWFAGAPKYHTGGVVGLRRDEYPAILQENEEVITADDPRHIFNGGKSGGGATAPVVQDVSVANYVDAQSFMSAALGTQQGRKLIMNVIQAERTKVRQLIGG